MSRDPLVNQVAGALRSAVHAHGPITADNIASAAKRMVGQLRAVEATQSTDAHWRRRYDQLRYGHNILIERHERMKKRLDAVRALHVAEAGACAHCQTVYPCPTIRAVDLAVTSPERARVRP